MSPDEWNIFRTSVKTKTNVPTFQRSASKHLRKVTVFIVMVMYTYAPVYTQGRRLRTLRQDLSVVWLWVCQSICLWCFWRLSRLYIPSHFRSTGITDTLCHTQFNKGSGDLSLSTMKQKNEQSTLDTTGWKRFYSLGVDEDEHHCEFGIIQRNEIALEKHALCPMHFTRAAWSPSFTRILSLAKRNGTEANIMYKMMALLTSGLVAKVKRYLLIFLLNE